MASLADKNGGRQNVLVATVPFTYATLTDATVMEAVDLPVNAIVIGGGVVVDTVWNSTTNPLDVGDATTGNRYKNDIDLKTLGYTALIPTGYKYTAADEVTLTVTRTGSAATTGAARLIVEYIIQDRATELQPVR